MKLKNITKNSQASEEIIKADTIVRRVRGLIGEDNPKSLYLETRWGIHTFGMKYSLDILILDSNWGVKKIVECLKPNRVLFWNPKYFRVLELPAGTIKNSTTTIGDIFTIK
jgi:uncharacterized membrane protein (UPF0127 family)